MYLCSVLSLRLFSWPVLCRSVLLPLLFFIILSFSLPRFFHTVSALLLILLRIICPFQDLTCDFLSLCCYLALEKRLEHAASAAAEEENVDTEDCPICLLHLDDEVRIQ